MDTPGTRLLSRGSIATAAVLLAVLAGPRPLAAQAKALPAQASERAVAVTSIPPAARAQLGERGAERRISARLKHRDRALVASIATRLRAGEPYEAVHDDWIVLVRRSDADDVDELERWVLREAYLEDLEAQQARLARAEAGAKEEPSDRRARIELQEAQQKQQQTLQTISNMQKAKHDAAMASIRNMK